MTRRTQMYFPISMLEELRVVAQREHVSVAELVRRAAQQILTQYQAKLDWKKDPLWDMIGSGKSHLKDLSVNHDHYLYGFHKKGKNLK